MTSLNSFAILSRRLVDYPLHLSKIQNMWIDTHAHLYLDKFDEDRMEMIDRAVDARVGHVFLPDIDSGTSDDLDALVEQCPQCHVMSGLHPCSVKKGYKAELEHVFHRLETLSDIVGVGEVGLDYYGDKTHVNEQQEAFEIQIEWARERSLPIIIHSRDSLDDTISTIEKKTRGDLTGIFHCFNGTLEQLERIVNVGFLVGIGGVVTFKNVDLDEMLRAIPRESYVLETDAPYLSPDPYRGKRNESSYIPVIGQYVAKVRGEEVNVIESVTTENALNLFGIDE